MSTDYSEIAAVYDENAIRHRIRPDAHLAATLGRLARRPLDALDLACGTGNYLAVQAGTFGREVRWSGLDASEQMLALARAKLANHPEVSLERGRAEALPYPDAAFDYVTVRFAFHHFADKAAALDEVRRVCRPGASLRYVNIDPSRMRHGWLFHFFPEAELEDQKRYWSPELVSYELEKRGYTVRLRVEVERGSLPLGKALEDAERRDMSELRILTDRAYAAGIARIHDVLARDPDARTVDEVAVARLEAVLG